MVTVGEAGYDNCTDFTDLDALILTRSDSKTVLEVRSETDTTEDHAFSHDCMKFDSESLVDKVITEKLIAKTQHVSGATISQRNRSIYSMDLYPALNEISGVVISKKWGSKIV